MTANKTTKVNNTESFLDRDKYFHHQDWEQGEWGQGVTLKEMRIFNSLLRSRWTESLLKCYILGASYLLPHPGDQRRLETVIVTILYILINAHNDYLNHWNTKLLQ